MANNKDLFGFLGGDIKTKIFSMVIIVLLIVLLIFGGKKLINFFKSMQITEKSELNNLILSGERLTYAESQYKVFADKIYTAMKGLGTDTSAVYTVFNAMNNKADVLKLVTVFGVRDDETLAEWMGGEKFLSVSQINKTLSNKGIDYQF